MTNTANPTALPPASLQTWCAKLPWANGYRPLLSADVKADTAWVVLSVPHGRKHSKEVRQWAKSVGAHFNSSHKQWRILPHRLTPDAITIINSLCLFHSVVSKNQAYPPSHTSRLAPQGGIIILNIPFEERGQAKADGARWDPNMKRWCFRVQHGNPHFAALVAKYESQGRVNVGETEAFNAAVYKGTGCVQLVKNQSIADSLIKHRPADAKEAEGEFRSKAWLGVNSHPDSTVEERDYLEGLLFAFQQGVPQTGESVMMQYVLHSPLTDEAARAIGAAPRVAFRRLIGKAEHLSRKLVLVTCYFDSDKIVNTYATAEDARNLWNTLVADGYTNAGGGGMGFGLLDAARTIVWNDTSVPHSLDVTIGRISDRRSNGSVTPPFPHLANG